MRLCVDVGNTQAFGGLFKDGELLLRFRKTSEAGSSADEYGIFLKSVLRENGYGPEVVKDIAFCSVVPDLVYSFRHACIKYFDIDPFILRPGVKTGLKIGYRNPVEVGADRIATAIAASSLWPDKNIIVVDFGTATTIDAISCEKRYLGGAISPGLRISMQVLEQKTAKLPTVEIEPVKSVCGKSTIESIQSGLYFGHLGMVKEIVSRLTRESFNSEAPFIIATGGFSRLYIDSGIFDEIQPDLVLYGLKLALEMNR